MEHYPFFAMSGWNGHHSPSTRTALGHVRSLSSSPMPSSSPRPSRSPVRSPSSSDLRGVVADFAPSHLKRVFSSEPQDDDLTTLPDPRSRAMSPANADGLVSPHHPDLDDEVATLSTKLINAINHQTSLDDTLSQTRLELEQSRQRVRQLEEQVAQQREMLAGDIWIRRKTVELEKGQLLVRVSEEKKARQEVEVEKKKIEQELENLTAALFEEANKMVISAKEEARREQDALQRRNDQLRAQLADTEGILRSQQEQLVELKDVMEQMTADREDQTSPTDPSSPGLSKFDAGDDELSADEASQAGLAEPPSPSHPTSFTHLLQTVVRTDLASYDDFRDLVRTSKRFSGHRVSTGSSGAAPSNASTTSLPLAGGAPSPHTPNTPASTLSASAAAANLPHLKDTKFYKRVLAEDIEPTLRLDIAPGLSWLARRGVVSAMTEGTVVVEPLPSNAPYAHISKPHLYPCSLCGESRKTEEHFRSHRFRINESDSAQRYPLCRYCLSRVRSTCDFLGFLRIVKDGHWRADDEDAEKAAWEESVRLREQMFWSRIGGGVVPVNPHAPHSVLGSPSIGGEKSPRPSHEEPKDVAAVTAEAPAEVPAPVSAPEAAAVDAPAPNPSAADVSETSAPPAADGAEEAAVKDAIAVEVPTDDGADAAAPPSDKRVSTQSLAAATPREAPQRLSLTIPGSSQDS